MKNLVGLSRSFFSSSKIVPKKFTNSFQGDRAKTCNFCLLDIFFLLFFREIPCRCCMHLSISRTLYEQPEPSFPFFLFLAHDVFPFDNFSTSYIPTMQRQQQLGYELGLSFLLARKAECQKGFLRQPTACYLYYIPYYCRT